MRYVKYAVLALLAVGLIAVSLANRQMVTLKVLPDGIAEYLPLNPSISLPLFLVIFAGIVLGLAIGYLLEWLREMSIRSEASSKGREVRRLERENRRLRAERPGNDGDEVLALLDEAK
jgi:hypothetical protein